MAFGRTTDQPRRKGNTHHTCIADVAVAGSGRPPDVAGPAPLGPPCMKSGTYCRLLQRAACLLAATAVAYGLLANLHTCCFKVVAHPDAARRLLDWPAALQLHCSSIQRLHQLICMRSGSSVSCIAIGQFV